MFSRSEIEGLKLCAKYSFTPNKLNYCGKPDSFKVLKEFIEVQNKENALKAKLALESFCALDEYLKLIAESNNKKKFDLDVVKAYWLGNSLLENIEKEKLKETLATLWEKKSTQDKKMLEKIEKIPETLKAHHSILLYFGFMNEKLKANELKNKGKCIISWAKVIEPFIKKGKNKGKIKVKGIELTKMNNSIAIKEKIKAIENPFNLKLKKNDVVSVHWNNAIEQLKKEEQKQLMKYTFNNLKAINL